VIFANKLGLNFLYAFLNMRNGRDRTDTCCDFQANFPGLPGRSFVFAGPAGTVVLIGKHHLPPTQAVRK